MTRLSVNVNKIATLRNARGGNVPDVLLAARRLQDFGAHGITVHIGEIHKPLRYSGSHYAQSTHSTRKILRPDAALRRSRSAGFTLRVPSHLLSCQRRFGVQRMRCLRTYALPALIGG